MALISCPECYHEVSDLAPMCPHCGYPVRKMEDLEEEMRQIGRRVYGEDWED